MKHSGLLIRGLLWLITCCISVIATTTCPQHCICSQTSNHPVLLSANCTELDSIAKFTQDNKNKKLIDTLYLSSLNISKIGRALDNLPSLRHLDLSNNSLTSTFDLPHKLTKLNLRRNKLTSLNFYELPRHIMYLDVSYNFISQLPLEIMQLSRLRTLNLQGNKMNCSDCSTIIVRDWLLKYSIISNTRDTIECERNSQYKTLNEVKKHVVCIHHKITKHLPDIYEMMQGDAPIDDEDAKAYEINGSGDTESDLEDYMVVSTQKADEKLTTPESETSESYIMLDDNDEGSGDPAVISDIPIIISSVTPETNNEDEGSGDEGIVISFSTEPTSTVTVTEDVGSGDFDETDDEDLFKLVHVETTTEEHASSTAVEEVFEKARIIPVESVLPENTESPDLSDVTTVSDGEGTEMVGVEIKMPEEQKKLPLGTYIFLSVLAVVIVCLICYVITRKHLKKRQARAGKNADIEKSGTEMIDVSKATLLKQNEEVPKVNGNAETYPLVNSKSEPNNIEDEDNKENEEHVEHNGVDKSMPQVPPTTPLTPETERVKITLSVIPDSVPKTPVLVTRTRSSAGDMIVTPAKPNTQ